MSSIGSEFDRLYEGKRVFVTGHTGFKGSWLCEWLLALGAEVAGYSGYIPSTPSNFESINLAERMIDIRDDIRDFASLQKAVQEFQPDIIFHLAAQPIVMESFADPAKTFETNLMGTVNVLEVIRQGSSIKTAVIITSDKCYENVEWEYGYRETDRLGGKDPYSASKACAEIAFASYWRSFFADSSDTAIATTRAGNVIGGGDWAADRIIPDCVRAWSKGESALVRNPYATRPWQHVMEPLSGYLLLGAQLSSGRDRLAGESFNFGPAGNANYTVGHLLEEMQAVWKGSKWHTENKDANRSKEASLLKLSCDKALNRLGWNAILDISQTADMTARWYMEYYDKANMHKFTVEQISEYTALAKEADLTWAMS